VPLPLRAGRPFVARVANVPPPVVLLAPPEHRLGLGIRVERFELAELLAHGHAGVVAVEQLGRREVDRVVVVGRVEDLEAEPVGDEAAVHQLAEVARVNVRKDVAPAAAGVGEVAWEVPYTSAPVRRWKQRAVTSLHTLLAAYESSGTTGCSSSIGRYSGLRSPSLQPYVAQ
jgi:hypothetical protein